ncbi:hypothetical protein, partial [Azorhizobium oxalatiphilum]|uniref:hypothetical protein n=1 Tax=Azorhizobium oxalatiphilum TaxID=980631 RepID=UPI001AED43CC
AQVGLLTKPLDVEQVLIPFACVHIALNAKILDQPDLVAGPLTEIMLLRGLDTDDSRERGDSAAGHF